MLKIMHVPSLPIDNSVVNVGIGELAFVRPPRKAATYGLGSCVAIVLINSLTRDGALIHAMLPHPAKDDVTDRDVGRYVSTSIPFVLKRLRKRPTDLIFAVIVGGAKILRACDHVDVGKRNVEVARTILKEYNVKIVDEDVGGNVSRSVLFDPDKGLVYVTSSTRLRLLGG